MQKMVGRTDYWFRLRHDGSPSGLPRLQAIEEAGSDEDDFLPRINRSVRRSECINWLSFDLLQIVASFLHHRDANAWNAAANMTRVDDKTWCIILVAQLQLPQNVWSFLMVDVTDLHAVKQVWKGYRPTATPAYRELYRKLLWWIKWPVSIRSLVGCYTKAEIVYMLRAHAVYVRPSQSEADAARELLKLIKVGGLSRPDGEAALPLSQTAAAAPAGPSSQPPPPGSVDSGQQPHQAPSPQQRANIAIHLLHTLVRDDIDAFIAHLRNNWWIWDTHPFDRSTYFYRLDDTVSSPWGLAFAGPLDDADPTERLLLCLTTTQLEDRNWLLHLTYLGYHFDPVLRVTLKQLIAHVSTATDRWSVACRPTRIHAHAKTHAML